MQNHGKYDADGNSGNNPVEVIGTAGKLAAEDFWGVMFAFAFLTIPAVWSATYLPEDDATRVSAFLGLAAILPQVLLTERALARHGLVEHTGSKRPSYAPRAFGLSLIGSLSIILGLIALVAPGLVLLARWSVALPVLIARNDGIIGSLRISWDLTKGRFWLCFLSILCAWVPALIGVAVYVLGYGSFSVFVGDVLLESLLSISMLLSWFVAVALYQPIGGKKGDLTG